ncbi:MAG TPA: hypothetical protein VIF14_17920 [Alphaproteobacteria bacterium]
MPTGGMWQSIPYTADAGERGDAPKAGGKTGPSAERNTAAAVKAVTPKTATPKTATPKTHPARHPVAAAATSEKAPPVTAAARTRELERRLDALLPGTRLGEPMADPENPSWRRPRPDRAGAENNSLSLPLDEKGLAGLIARGYHVRPDVQNPAGNTGATIGLRTRF